VRTGVIGAAGLSGATIRLATGAEVAGDFDAGDVGWTVVFDAVVTGEAGGVIVDEDLASGRGTSGRSGVFAAEAASGEEDGVIGARCAAAPRAEAASAAAGAAVSDSLLFLGVAAIWEGVGVGLASGAVARSGVGVAGRAGVEVSGDAPRPWDAGAAVEEEAEGVVAGCFGVVAGVTAAGDKAGASMRWLLFLMTVEGRGGRASPCDAGAAGWEAGGVVANGFAVVDGVIGVEEEAGGVTAICWLLFFKTVEGRGGNAMP
jgi:hypothetical protein